MRSEGIYAVNFGNAIYSRWRSVTLSQLSDGYLIGALRGMEKRVPETENIEDLELGFVACAEDVPDPEEVKDYEVFKIEAETRGLTWRQCLDG